MTTRPSRSAGVATVSVSGRVLYRDDRELTVLGDGVVHQLPGVQAGTCRAGDLVRVSGDPPAVSVVWAHPTGCYPGADGLRWLADASRWDRMARRADLLFQTRRFFRQAGFVEIETPLLVPAPGTEVHLDPVPAELRPGPGQPPERRFLITSPEAHMKRLLVADAPPIFQICKVFRDGERGVHHRPEFTMLEWYRPWSGYERLMEDCEAWLRALAGADEITHRGRRIDLRPPWTRLTFREALRTRGDVTDPDALSPDEQLRVLVERVEPTLGEERPEFLVEYPIAMASLARPSPRDPRVAERFELFVGGLELGNAFGELTDATEQRRRCLAENTERRRLGLSEMPLDEPFLGALEDGMPPSAGIAVGLDRVIMLLTDAPDIDAVLAF